MVPKTGTRLSGHAEDKKRARLSALPVAAGPSPARAVSRPESGGREGRSAGPKRASVDVETERVLRVGAIALMSTPLQRSFPTVLAALAGLALAAGAVRLEEGLRRRKPDRSAAPLGAVRAAEEPRTLQVARAEQPGRGRDAAAPTRIPWRGWKDILWRTYARISSDRLLLIAGGVVFYGLLATVPAITALVSLYGLFASAE